MDLKSCSPAGLFLITIIISLILYMINEMKSDKDVDYGYVISSSLSACIIFVFLVGLCYLSSMLGLLLGAIFVCIACSMLCSQFIALF